MPFPPIATLTTRRPRTTPNNMSRVYKRIGRTLMVLAVLTSSAYGQETSPAGATGTPPQVTAEDTINALNGVFGRHARERSSHAKGFCVGGHFQPASGVSALGGVPLFNEKRLSVVGRFSIGGGNPKASDKSRSVRGLGIRLTSPDDALDLVMISAPVFFASTPEQFVQFLKARTADPQTGQKDPAKIAAFNKANPNVMSHLTHLANTPPPASYAATPYYSAHAFLFAKADTKPVAARWDFQPVGGFQGLTPEQEEQFPNDFLQAELAERLETAPAQWDAFLQLAQEGDDINDPTSVWHAGRDHHVKVGRLTIDRLIEPGAEDDCTGLVFDPNNLADGISPTDDPILAIRRPAYAISFGRRVE